MTSDIPDPDTDRKYADLKTRVISALIMASIAFADLWLGGVYTILLMCIIIVLLLWEYRRIHHTELNLNDRGLVIVCIAGMASVIGTGIYGLLAGFGVIAIGVAALLGQKISPRRWIVPGFVYIALGVCVLVAIRENPVFGFQTILWLILVVVAADVGGYFAGRTFGGPKLWPAVSPKKTWSGALGGLGLALIVGIGFSMFGSIPVTALPVLSVLLAMASQAGDLLESSYKRHFGAKDSSGLIPGHGGLMDRLDGLAGALLAFGVLSLIWPGI